MPPMVEMFRCSALALLLVVSGLACSCEAEQRLKLCKDALEDGNRFASGPDMEKTKKQLQIATANCAAEKQGEVDKLAKSIQVREQQKTGEKETAERIAAQASARPATDDLGLPSADGSVETSNVCKVYVDCVCGLADAIKKGTGKDTYRSRCEEAKKAVDGKQRQDPACREMLGEVTKDDGWKSVCEAKGVTIPPICP